MLTRAPGVMSEEQATANRAGEAIAVEPVRQAEAAELIALSDAYSLERYPAEGHFGSSVEELDGNDVSFVIMRVDGAAIGCVAMKWNADRTAELKRLFVRAEGRGRGAGRKLMAVAENLARDRGMERVNLETGPLNREAVSLYEASGFVQCGPFPPYEANPYSLFMTKELKR